MSPGEAIQASGTEALTSAGHQLLVQSGQSEAFPLGKTEVDRFCRRLRKVVNPVLSHETWAATLFGVFVGLFIAYTTLPTATQQNAEHTAYLRGAFHTGWIAALAGTAIFGSLAIGEYRRKKQSEPFLVAKELEEICEERMGQVPKP